MNQLVKLLSLGWLSIAAQADTFESEYLSVQSEGSGPDVILIHGFACSPEVWADLKNAIGADYRLHTVALAGLAGEPAPASAPDSYLTTLRDELCRYIEIKELQRPVLIGHSMGGLIALLVASLDSAEPGKVIAVDALPFISLIFNPFATSELMQPLAKMLEEQLMRLGDLQFETLVSSFISMMTQSDDKRQQLIEWSRSSDRKAYAQYLHEIMSYDARPELNAITCPVYILYAHDEAMGIPKATLTQLYTKAYANLKNVHIENIPDSMHFIMWDQPAVFGRKIQQALAQISPHPF